VGWGVGWAAGFAAGFLATVDVLVGAGRGAGFGVAASRVGLAVGAGDGSGVAVGAGVGAAETPLGGISSRAIATSTRGRAGDGVGTGGLAMRTTPAAIEKPTTMPTTVWVAFDQITPCLARDLRSQFGPGSPLARRPFHPRVRRFPSGGQASI
jgi:hypothetical protein